MMINTLELLVFINQSLYCYSAFPQIIANYRNKSGVALSDFYLMLLFNTYAMLLFYFFCLEQPVCYRLSIATQFLTTLTLVVQRFYYNRDTRFKALLVFYVFNTILLLGFVPWAIVSSCLVGNATGWIVFGLILINRLPQMIKFYRTKSVEGFSPLFLVLFCSAGIMEMGVVLAYQLPIQTLFMTGFGFTAILIMSFQWWLYSKK